MRYCKAFALIFFFCSGAVYSYSPNEYLGWYVDFEKNRRIDNSLKIFGGKTGNAENLTPLFASYSFLGAVAYPRFGNLYFASMFKMPNAAGKIFLATDSAPTWRSKRGITEDYFAEETGNSDSPTQSRYQAAQPSSSKGASLPAIRFFTHPEIPGSNQLFIAPIAGWNLYNGFMFGLGLFNQKLIERPTRISIMPLWGELSNSIAGQFHIAHSIEPASPLFQNIQMGAYGRRYASFSDIHSPSSGSFLMFKSFVNADIRLPESRIDDELTVFFNSHYIQRYQPGTSFHTLDFSLLSYFINQLGVNYVNNTASTPFAYKLELEQGPQFVKTTARAQFFSHYNASPGGLFVRFFGGAFMQTPPADSPYDFRLRLGAHRGVQDYTFIGYFLGRSERMGTLAGNQITESQGGFSFPTSVGQTWQWLATVNFKADVPNLPFRLFFDAGTYAGAATAFQGSRRISWVAGVHFEPIRNVLRVNFPVAASSDINQVASFAFDRYIQRITYSIYFDRLNVWKFLHTRRFRDLFPEYPW